VGGWVVGGVGMGCGRCEGGMMLGMGRHMDGGRW